VRFLLFLLTATLASALPDREEARRRLGSDRFEERQAITVAFWKAGKAAVPLLEELADDPDPEIARRARFVLHRLVMGLGPEASGALLRLATKAEQAPFEARSGRLGDLLEHPGGLLAALSLADRWISDELSPHEHRVSLTEVVVEWLLEERSFWKPFLTSALSPRTRAYFVGILSIQETPLKEQLIAILARDDLRQVHQTLVARFEILPDETRLTLARLAILGHDLDLATKTLALGLIDSDSTRPARALAFLEKSVGLPRLSFDGPRGRELALFRARADRNPHKTARLAAEVADNIALAYESRLLAGDLTLPDQKETSFLAEAESLPVWHSAFAHPPGEPDIEALTSSLVIEWPVLARTLTALGHPVEAAERLASEEQSASAIGLLWRTGHRDEALALAAEILAAPGEEQHIKLRLTMVSFLLEAGEKKKAAEIFEPLTHGSLREGVMRRRAIPLALRLFPLDKVVGMEQSLRSGRPFDRQRAAAPFLAVPPQVAGYWYEHFYDPKSKKRPAEVIREARKFLKDQLPQAQKFISEELSKLDTKPLHTTDLLYQNALFLRVPEALDLVEEAAWRSLEPDDLLGILRSEDWSLASRQRALESAIALAPTDPVVRWYDFQMNGCGDPKTITLLTLGDPGLALRLASLTQKRETLAITARIADFRNSSTLRFLGIVGKSHLETGEPEIAARLLLASLLGEIAIGTRPASSIQNSLDLLTALFQARLQLAPSEAEKEIWRARLAGLGSDLPSQ